MRETHERELKLRAPDGFELPALGGEPLDPRVFVSTYHDTADFRLARAGATLRHRVENGRGLWQLKLSRGEGRLELESDGGPVAVPGEQLALLPALTRGRELEPVARLRTRRSGVRVARDGAVAEVVLDAVAVLAGQRVTRAWEEVEVELLEGDPALLRRLGKELRRAGADEPELRPKVVQALGLDLDVGDGEPTTAVEALGAALRRQVAQLLRHDPGVRVGGDPEDVHQLRVAARRSRAFLRAARPLLDADWEQGLQTELRWLGGALGPVRDHDVLLAYLRAEADTLDDDDRSTLAAVFARLEQQGAQARAAMLDVLDGDRYLALLDRLEEAAARPHTVGEERPLADLWWREWRRLRRAVAALDGVPPDDDLHATRIRAKRARYAAELAEPVLGRRGRRFVSRAKTLQDVLGEHQDAVVAEERLRELLRGSRSRGAALAAGRLVERQRARRAAARTGFADAWTRLERAGRRVADA
jgi:CHAD domain-containing protein